MRDGAPDHKQLRMFITGPGGTGKSFLIQTITMMVREHYQNVGGRYGPVVLMAPTGE